ncbi:Apoptosis-inducing factor 1 [Polyrhizophydium stewartii]|uniref:Apoptosis-inducing factor 1 n=1 Tax=Polyrhizophydium stewartii TaxID=2732419 RepID=A0ABR4N0Q0_9FUNG|nr:hypothetical protein HK105_005256 [Polyrhizophydium stewartii]
MSEFEVAHVNDLKDGEMKEVAVGGLGKALLSKIDGEFFATSHLCPHYKAPLSKGTLSSDGRIMCPWHGACFRAQTGDIEDAPSVDGLASFKVTVRGDKVFIKANPDEIKAGRKVPIVRKFKCTPKRAVIVGGGAGGLVAAETLRKEGFDGEILLLSREPYLPVDRPKLSKALNIDATKIALRDAEHFKNMNINVRLATIVKAVDTKAKTVTLESGESVTYNHLVLATGGDPRVLPINGKDLGNIFVIRDVKDANAIGEALPSNATTKRNVVIVGSSFIGMEAASILVKQANVTVIGMEKVPFERVLGNKVGDALMKLNIANGVKFELEALVDHYLPSASNPKQVGFVVLKSGKKIPADVVILGAGVFPQTTYLKDSGITLDRDGGITVTAGMQVPGAEDVYAVGDIARYPYHLTGESVRVEHWNVAQNQGRVAALNIVAKEHGKAETASVEFKQVPYFWTVQFGKSVRYAGHATSFDSVVIQGSLDHASEAGLSFAAFYFRKGVMVAVCSVAKDPVVSHVSELMRLGKAPTEAQIHGLDVLKLPLKSNEKFVPPKKASASSPDNTIFLIAAGLAGLIAVLAPIAYYIRDKAAASR